MVEFGAADRWPSKYCARKWEELHPETFAHIPRAQPPPRLDESTAQSPEGALEQISSPRSNVFDDIRNYKP